MKLTVKEAAKQAGVTEKTIYNWIEKGLTATKNPVTIKQTDLINYTPRKAGRPTK